MAFRSACVMILAALAVLVAAMRAPDLHVVLADAEAALREHRAAPEVDHASPQSVELTKASAPRGEGAAPPVLVAVRVGSPAARIAPLLRFERQTDPPARQRARLMVFLI